MIFVQLQAYSGFMSGAVVMISLHNMFLSFFLYKTRQTNVSNLIKIIFNFSNILRFGALWGIYMTPKVATLLQCTALLYVTSIGSEMARVSLAAFLLWRVKQVHNNKLDSWISITLLVIRVGLTGVILSLLRAGTTYQPDQDIIICQTSDGSRDYVLAAIVVEFIVDLYVTVRLVQVLRKANTNAATISSNVARKSKRTLFTAVMYWNFLRLFVAVISHVAPLLNTFQFISEDDSDVVFFSLFPTIIIILSYVITVDAEIVRVIEGKNAKKGSSAGTEKSFSTSQGSRTPRGGHSSSNLPKYSQSTSDTYDQIDKDKIAVVSMKRLSFFEWANFVVGNRLHRDDEEQYGDEEDENTEEIIYEPSKVDNNDIEKGFPQDRSSSISGTTSVSTLDENPDIVIS